MKESEMADIASLIARALKSAEDDSELEAIRAEVSALTSRFPIHDI
jgi:glycine/serine hydroxymethyltransferase